MSKNESEVQSLTVDEVRPRFLEAAQDPGKANEFFDRLEFAHELHAGRFSQALNHGIADLEVLRTVDANAYGIIHKGTPFYWLGTAAFCVHDYETAVYFFDAAVSEDVRAGADPVFHPTPAFRFIQVQGDPEEQAARELVQAMQRRFEEIISDYNSRPGGGAPVTLDQIRTRLLQPAMTATHESWRSLATALISFVLEWDYRYILLGLRSGSGTSEPFFMHLFKGCVLFESLLKSNPHQALPKDANTLGKVLDNLHSHLGIPAHIKIGNADLGTILGELNGADDSLRTAVEFTGKIRNTVGHDLGWQVRLDKEQYRALFRMVTIACIHAIARLYG